MKYQVTWHQSLAVRALRAAALTCAAASAAHLAPSDAQARQHPTRPDVSQQAAVAPAAEERAAGTTGSAEARGRIEGLVETESGRPLSNATVVARPAGGGGTPTLVSTDAEGRFRLSGLAPAAYILSATAPGYVSAPPAEGSAPAYYRPGDTASLRLIKGGVITGVVTDQSGSPLVAARVRVARLPGTGAGAHVRDVPRRDASTDDRGVYRVYGLEPGSYLVSVGGTTLFNTNPGAKADGPPTYYPSSTRASAAKVGVEAGQEVAGIDIQRRELRGYTVSGLVEVAAGAPAKGFGVALLDAATGEIVDTLALQGGERAFAFRDVSEGEYDLVARGASGADEAVASAPRRVTLKGQDVSGVALTLSKTVALSGRVVIEPPTDADAKGACADARPFVSPREVVVGLSREDAVVARGVAGQGGRKVSEAAAGTDGSFVLGGLQPGRYALRIDLPRGGTFVRAVRAEADALGRKPAAEVVGTSLSLPAGASDLRLTLSLGVGAGALKGRVAAGEGASAQRHALVFLVPASPVSGDDPLRFAVAAAGGDGTFAFEHVAPGSYRLLALPDAGDRPRITDAAARARLRREAEASGAPVTIRPCQRIEGFDLPAAARPPATAAAP